ncbi:MaoC family dehydratase [Pseudomonas sp. TTU2014-080ASC]|uniref:MaoC family dehydratase n=1 Tax=Pseudomonas sp. TTU2014-080ASC TaxID=1729724 RepID=UPI0007188DCE|nr:MaoC family dehydratase [Pseudomonas sp. TTU2014-080ASC]KRW57441.1 dehydratase [Pseudomonas sp. TTU2014-080ASC]
MSTVFKSTEQMLASTGMDLGVTDWVVIDQARINLFAEATGDHQWIHVDETRAAAGPFGCTVAHGFLTLSLANLFLPQLIILENMLMGVNYGCDKVRFPAPVRVNSLVRGRGEVIKVEQIGEAVQQTVRVTVEIEGSERPGCVVDTVSRYTFNPVSE